MLEYQSWRGCNKPREAGNAWWTWTYLCIIVFLRRNIAYCHVPQYTDYFSTVPTTTTRFTSTRIRTCCKDLMYLRNIKVSWITERRTWKVEDTCNRRSQRASQTQTAALASTSAGSLFSQDPLLGLYHTTLHTRQISIKSFPQF